jgi:haloalkane dehalogenase
MATATPIHPSTPTAPLTEASLARAFRSRPQRFIDIGHTRVAYWKFGAGPDLVFIHGWPLDAATFRRIVPRLAERFTCHLFDLPGVGQSESDADAPIDLVSHADSARALVDALGLSSYALLAHDSGGFVARLLAANDARVTKIVLGDTEIPGHTPPMIIAYAALAKLPFGPSVLKALLKPRWLQRSALGFGGCFTDASYLDGPFHDLFVRPLVESDTVARRHMVLLSSLHASMMELIVEAQRKITAPVLLVWGTKDPFFPIEKARKMVTQFGGPVSFEEIAGAKVFPHEDRADEFVGHALGFL